MRYSDASGDAAWFHLAREAMDLPVVALFTVDGEPVSKARARFTNYGSKVRSYTPEKTLVAEQRMAEAFKAAAPDHKLNPDATYGLTAIFFHGTRQRRDVDNMLKLILDGLNGVAWQDDVHVVEVSGRKCLEVKEDARTEVLVYRVGTTQRLTAACAQCGEHFEVFPSSRRRFCSRRCANDAKRAPVPPCRVCGEPVSHRVNTFCSQVCAGIAKRKPARRCVTCGAAVSHTSKQLCRPCWVSRSTVTITPLEESA